jgi:hypothetical protein
MSGKILISHRGNVHGPDSDRENSESYIEEALRKNYHVEIDVWSVKDKLFLGHDEPQYRTDIGFLSQSGLWIHCKNVEALSYFSRFHSKLNFFWHQADRYTLTSHKYIWAYPGAPIINTCVAVLPETVCNWDISKAIGICSDYIGDIS